MTSMVKYCKKCSRLKYIVTDNTCFSCVKENNPEKVLVGIYTNKCTIDSDWVNDVIDEAQSNFPRIVHTNNYSSINSYIYSNVHIKEDHLILRKFNVYYKYNKYDGSKRRRLCNALKDMYRDVIDNKFS